ncbi:MAG: hypothetical protein AB7I27_14545 [Bacteriovoracaceae bacterium]
MKLFIISFFCLLFANHDVLATNNCDLVGAPRVEMISELSTQMCLQKLRSKSCLDVYKKIKSEGHSVAERGLRCADDKSLAVTGVEFLKGCAQGGWGFVKSLFVPIGTSIGEGVASVVVGREEFEAWNSNCSKSNTSKMAIYEDYNKSVPSLMRVSPISGKIDLLSCALIKDDLDQKRMKLQPRLDSLRLASLNKNYKFTDEEKEYVDFVNRGKVTFDQKAKTSLVEDAKALLEKKGIELSCYNREYQTALLCEAVANVVSLAVTGIAVARASKLTEIAGIEVQAEKLASEATSSTRRIASLDELKLMSPLNQEQRVAAAEKLLGRKLSSDGREADAIQAAHEIGKAEGRGFGSYTQRDKVRKALILRRAGFSRPEAELLLDRGVAGSMPKVSLVTLEKEASKIPPASPVGYSSREVGGAAEYAYANGQNLEKAKVLIRDVLKKRNGAASLEEAKVYILKNHPRAIEVIDDLVKNLALEKKLNYWGLTPAEKSKLFEEVKKTAEYRNYMKSEELEALAKSHINSMEKINQRQVVSAEIDLARADGDYSILANRLQARIQIVEGDYIKGGSNVEALAIMSARDAAERAASLSRLPGGQDEASQLLFRIHRLNEEQITTQSFAQAAEQSDKLATTVARGVIERSRGRTQLPNLDQMIRMPASQAEIGSAAYQTDLAAALRAKKQVLLQILDDLERPAATGLNSEQIRIMREQAESMLDRLP